MVGVPQVVATLTLLFPFSELFWNSIHPSLRLMEPLPFYSTILFHSHGSIRLYCQFLHPSHSFFLMFAQSNFEGSSGSFIDFLGLFAKIHLLFLVSSSLLSVILLTLFLFLLSTSPQMHLPEGLFDPESQTVVLSPKDLVLFSVFPLSSGFICPQNGSWKGFELRTWKRRSTLNICCFTARGHSSSAHLDGLCYRGSVNSTFSSHCAGELRCSG